jgi:hypothetical protein
MKKTLVPILVLLMVAMVFLPGCGSGITQQQYDDLKGQLTAAQNDVADWQNKSGEKDKLVDSLNEAISAKGGQIEAMQKQAAADNKTISDAAANLAASQIEVKKWKDQAADLTDSLANLKPFADLYNGVPDRIRKNACTKGYIPGMSLILYGKVTSVEDYTSAILKELPPGKLVKIENNYDFVALFIFSSAGSDSPVVGEWMSFTATFTTVDSNFDCFCGQVLKGDQTGTGKVLAFFYKFL